MTNSNFEFQATGTKWVIDLFNQPLSSQVTNLIKNTVNTFESKYSRFIDSSLISQMSQHVGDYVLDDDGVTIYNIYLKLNKLTSGAFTPTIGQLLNQSGYDSNYSFKSNKLTTPPTLNEVLKFQPPNLLTVLTPCPLDFGGVGKGYLVDVISQIIIQSGCSSFCVDAGGDMYYKHHQNKPLQVGLEHPNDLNQAIGIISITNQALAASSGNRRHWGQFHHIIDPHSLSSPKHILATWVISSKAIIADAVATCLFLVTPEILIPHFDFDFLILYSDLTFTQSQGFTAEIFYQKSNQL